MVVAFPATASMSARLKPNCLQATIFSSKSFLLQIESKMAQDLPRRKKRGQYKTCVHAIKRENAQIGINKVRDV
jgi:hypothetical protein